MAYQLKLDEMLDALCNASHPQAAEFTVRLESLANEMARAICAANPGLECEAASFQGMAFAGTCVPFYGAELPDMIAAYDDETEFCTLESWQALCNENKES